jgi:MoxR-like ATPase
MDMTIQEIAAVGRSLEEEISKAIVGKKETVQSVVLGLLCGGHMLIEDVPGVGKTTLAKAIAKTIGGEFRRIQFTPDLLPSDITGSSVYNQDTHDFEFKPGPLFANVVLVDEVNRATPKTQSALLEAMEEHQVSADGVTRPLPEPFFVLATQNNIEMTGTYPLPEAQLDRFFARVSIGYPSRESETDILRMQQSTTPVDGLSQRITLEQLSAAIHATRQVYLHDSIRTYIVDVVRATRETGQLALGSSPRGSLNLMHAAQARAALDGSQFVRPDDVKSCASLILGHRVILRGEVRAKGVSGQEVIQMILETVPSPVATPA